MSDPSVRPLRLRLLVAAAVVSGLLGVPASGAERRPIDTSRPAVPGELVVAFRGSADATDRANAHAVAGADRTGRLRRLNIDVVRARGDLVRTAARYLADPRVRYVEPNYLVRPLVLPDDDRWWRMWGLHNTGQAFNGTIAGTLDADIDAPEAWDVTTGSRSIKVAIIDTGTQVVHPDLQPNIGETFNAATGGTDVSEPFTRDGGHGTHVSGTIGALGNNGVGVVGVNWQVSLMPVKFDFSLSQALSGMNWARDHGAMVINASWGGSGTCPQSMSDTLASLNSAGVLFVAAAGNENRNIDVYPSWPAGCSNPNVITVAATDYNDARASFSSYGATHVDLGAPGVTIASTYPTNFSGSTGYAFMSGTSMSSPHVAGAAALVWARTPTLTAAQVKQALLGSTDPIPSLAGRTVTGGRLNLARALGATPVASPTASPTASPSPSPTPSPTPGGTATPTPTPTASPTPSPTPTPASTPTGWSRVEQTSQAITYTGRWSTVPDGRASGGSFGRSLTLGSSARFGFTGTGIRWIGHRDSIGGIAEVYIDGVYAGDVDMLGSTQFRQILFERTGLGAGPHTIEVRVTSKRRSRYTYVDAFDVRT